MVTVPQSEETVASPEIPPDEPAKVVGQVDNVEVVEDTQASEFAAVRRGRGRPRKDGSAPQSAYQKTQVDIPPVNPFDAKRAREVGELIGRSVVNMTGTISPDFSPHTPQEIALSESAIHQTGQFFVDSKLPDIPPGIALVLAWGQYYGALAVAERNRPKIRNLWDKFRAWRQMRKFEKEHRK